METVDASTRRRAIDDGAAETLANLASAIRGSTERDVVVVCDIDGTIEAAPIGGDEAIMAVLEEQWRRFRDATADVRRFVLGGRLWLLAARDELDGIEQQLLLSMRRPVAWEGRELFSDVVIWRERIDGGSVDGVVARLTDRLAYNRGQTTRALARSLQGVETLSELVNAIVEPGDPPTFAALEVLDEDGAVLARSSQPGVGAPDLETTIGSARQLRFRLWELEDVWDRNEYEHLLREAGGIVAAAIDRVTAIETARALAERDPLTGLLNRSGAWSRMSTFEVSSCALAIVDLDHLKSVNDTWGHAVGDVAITSLAALLPHVVGDGLAARWGGEEFLLVLPTDAVRAEDGLNTMLARAWSTEVHPSVPLSFSAGLTDWPAGEPFAEAFERADQALYAAKAGGRGRVRVAKKRRA